MPEIPDGLLETRSHKYQQLRYGYGVPDADPDLVCRGRELYWALVDWYDAQVRLVLDALDRSQSADNTVMLYTSDYGKNKGDHGLWWKNNMTEHAARIPLILQFPELWQAVSAGPEAAPSWIWYRPSPS
jgi:arylsulfatase A-like enzyme